MDDKENKKEENINNTNNDMKPDNEPYNVTREINLDELYDGAINNTVVIDPVTNDEVLMTSKKTNYTFIGVLLSILVFSPYKTPLSIYIILSLYVKIL